MYFCSSGTAHLDKKQGKNQAKNLVNVKHPQTLRYNRYVYVCLFVTGGHDCEPGVGVLICSISFFAVSW